MDAQPARPADRTPAPPAAPLTDRERRLIRQAAEARPREGHRLVEAMCALGALTRLR